MILTCPECSTKYMAKDGMIGPNGRSVRCASCKTTWFVAGADPDALALEDNQTVLMTPELEQDSQIKQPLMPVTPFPAAVGPHTLLRNKAHAEKLSKRYRAIRFIWALPLLLLVTAAILVFVKRQAIVETHPKSATIFQAVGVNITANGLDIESLSSQRLVIDGEDVLRVNGEVVNLTSEDIASPLIQLRLENRSGEALGDWFVEAGNIPARSRITIETDYPSPPIDGVELRYRFVPDSE